MADSTARAAVDPREVLVFVEALEQQIQKSTSGHIKRLLLESGCALMDAVIEQHMQPSRKA